MIKEMLPNSALVLAKDLGLMDHQVSIIVRAQEPIESLLKSVTYNNTQCHKEKKGTNTSEKKMDRMLYLEFVF